MALVTTDFNINITPGAMPPVVHVSEYDIGRSYTVGLIGENNDTFTIPTGTTATIEGTLNGVVGFSVPATISNNKVAFTLTESMTAYAGKAWCKIKLTLNDEPIQTCAFILAVDRAGVESETVIGAPGFEEQIADAAAEWMEQQGFTSPTVSVAPITGGNRVTFTDKDGTETMSVMNGKDGQPGADGKSAYQYAQDGGYTGTEEEFAAKIAAPIQGVADTFFTEKYVELIGEMEVGFRDNSLSGYHKKMIPVEPGKTYIVNWFGWMDYFDENKATITEGYTMTNTAGNNYTLTIPEGSPLRYIRTTVQDINMTDSLPSCYEGSVNIGEITRGSKLVTFDYADNEKMENAFEAYSGENLIDGSQCTEISGGWYQSQLVPAKAGEKYYTNGLARLKVYNHCGKAMPHTWTYPDDWQPDTGTPVTGNNRGVYTVPEWTYFVSGTTKLVNGQPDCWLVKSPKKITAEQLGKPFIDSDIAGEFVKEYFDSQHLYGLTLCCLGDSVTNMSGYGALVAEKYGMINISGGTDGASYTSADGLAANQIAYNKVNSLDANTDVVVLMFGTNDISNSREIGTFTDNDLTTLYGALRKTFDLLTTKFTGKRIGVVTSPQRNFNTCTYDTWKQYNDVIKKMAMLYKIPVLDGEYAGLVYGLANDYSHFTDDVHPASAGSAALAYNIGKFIETLPIYCRDGE